MESSHRKVEKTERVRPRVNLRSRLIQASLSGMGQYSKKDHNICPTTLSVTIDRNLEPQKSEKITELSDDVSTKTLSSSEGQSKNFRTMSDNSNNRHNGSNFQINSNTIDYRKESIHGFKDSNHQINDFETKQISYNESSKEADSAISIDCTKSAHKRGIIISGATVKISFTNKQTEPMSNSPPSLPSSPNVIADISVFNNSNVSASDNSDVPALVTPHSLPSSNVTSKASYKSNILSKIIDDQSDIMSVQKMFLTPSDDCFIPPPITLSTPKLYDSNSSLDKNGNCTFYNSLEFIPDDYETISSIPDSEHLKAISNFIEEIIKEQTACLSTANDVIRDLNLTLKNDFEGKIIDIYGSYDSELALSSSDINLVMIKDVPLRRPAMYEVYKFLANELKKYHVQPFKEGLTAHETRISFSHPKTGVNCELAYLGRYESSYLKMGKFLRKTCLKNNQVKSLIMAAKIWAKEIYIDDVEEGKLHTIGFSLLVIYFLQHCEKPLLPIYCLDEKGRLYFEETELLPYVDSSVGELWMNFLRFYCVTFNWKQDVVTIISKNIVSKKSKNWENYWMAIEDPFTGKNVAEKVVNSDVAEYIKACFMSSYGYFCNQLIPTEDNPSDEVPSNSMEFSFSQCIMELNEAFCEECDEIGDVCNDCKKKIYVQPMASVPKMTDNFLNLINKALITVYDKYLLSNEEVNERKQFVKELENEVCRSYPDAQLNLFGSSTNGFGFKYSDLDICVTFKTNKIRNPSAVLKEIRFLLRRDKRFDNVVCIFNAKIPIIKFHFQPKNWRGDISLDNVLAVHNSELLYTYSLIDERCKILGCALKLLAKKAFIADVTEKALSSYSYLNMVIHFLQQTEPPVLPALQDSQFRGDDYKLDDIVENCNVWFCKDPNYIKKTFKAENDSPVEKLWLELLDYYCSFDNEKFITIRQKEALPVSENHSSAPLFNIQDPFIETKNLGRVVSERKAQETKSVLNRARMSFRTPIKELPTSVKDIEDYFFSSMSLTGRVQKEAYCDICGKFGHEKTDCKQSGFPMRRPNFRWFHKMNPYKNRNTNVLRKPNSQPYRRQFST